MPLVKPKDKEKREDFMSRCMRDETSTSEYPNADQRLAVCSSQFKKNNKEEYSMSDIEKMGDAIKSLTDVISKGKYGDGKLNTIRCIHKKLQIKSEANRCICGAGFNLQSEW